MGEFQVGQYLLLVDTNEGFDGLQLDKNRSSHDKIRTKTLIESLPAKVNRNGFLPFDRKSALFESICQQNLVNRFQ